MTTGWWVYLIGLVVVPLVFGVIFRNEVHGFDEDDYVLFGIMLIIWPAVVAFLVIGVVLVGIFYFPFKLVKVLLRLGDVVSTKIERWRREREMRKELEREKLVRDAKPGDAHYFDYVCD